MNVKLYISICPFRRKIISINGCYSYLRDIYLTLGCKDLVRL